MKNSEQILHERELHKSLIGYIRDRTWSHKRMALHDLKRRFPKGEVFTGTDVLREINLEMMKYMGSKNRNGKLNESISSQFQTATP